MERKVRRRQLTFVTLLICELCLLILNARPLIAAQQQTAPVNPLDQGLPERALRVVGASPDRFNEPVLLRFSLKGARFDRTVADVILTVNGVRVTSQQIKISAHQIATGVRLADGANIISLRAYDTIGRTLYYNETIWCGNWSLRVDLARADGTPVQSVTTVRVTLPRADNIGVQQITNRGSVTLKNLPAQKLIITVRTSDGASAIRESFGSAGTVRIELQNSST